MSVGPMSDSIPIWCVYQLARWGSTVLTHLLLVTHHWEYCLNRSNLVSAIR